MFSLMNLPSMIFAVFSVVLPTGQAVGAASQPAVSPNERALIADLSSPQWRARDEATGALMEQGPQVFEPLRQEFRRNGSYETRRRIKEIAREVYLTEKLGPPMAFLGISHNRYDLRCVDEPRIEPGYTALRIESVFSGTAADRAGLQPGDLFTAINGKRATLEDPATNLTKWIASQRPGTTCRIGIIRGGHGIRIESSNIREFNLERFNRLKLLAVLPKDDPLVPTNGAGLRIVESFRMSDDVTLERGDLIIALNDQLISKDDPQKAYKAWINNIAAIQSKGEPEEVEIRMQGGQPQIVPKGRLSVQIVRGGAKLELNLRLGRRPGFLRSGVQPAWQVDPAAIEDATAAFEAWWTDHFDPSHSFVEQADLSPQWRFESEAR